MRDLFKKYLIVVVATIVTVRLLTAIILTIWPDLLIIHLPNNGTTKLGSEFIYRGFDSLLNIVIIYLLYNDMKKEKVLNIPILILTFFSSLLGVIFFFLTIAFNELSIKKNNRYE
jgi:hypothetical protein